MEKTLSVYFWEYIVKEGFREEFQRVYGPGGDWEQLFKKADGYIKTDLHQDMSNKKRYLTIDYWSTNVHLDNFLIHYSKEYSLLDERCEKYTSQESLIGNFDLLNHSYPI